MLTKVHGLVIALILLIPTFSLIFSSSVIQQQFTLQNKFSVPKEVAAAEDNEDNDNERNKEYDLLVLVLAGSYDDGTYDRRYKWQRSVWSEVARAVARRNLPVRIYLMTMDPEIKEPMTASPIGGGHRDDDDDLLIKIPGNNSIIPGVLDMTVKSMEYVRTAKLPGHRHKYVLRTNLSSFWCFMKYLDFIKERFPPGSKGVYNGVYPGGFVSGAGFLLSQDLETLLIQDKQNLDFQTVDDVAIGNFFIERHNVTATHGIRKDFVSPLSLLAKTVAQLSTTNHYHFRIKTVEHAEFIPSNAQENLIMSYLFFLCYGEEVNVSG